MSMLIPIILILIGFLLLIWSADLLVDNASVLANKLGVSAFLIGVIIIGFGTSAPEMFVSAMAALENKGNLGLGNALGSNITNIGLVLGAAALVKGIPVARNTALFDMPAVLITGAIAILMILDGVLSKLDGLILLLMLLGYLIWTSKNSLNSEPAPNVEDLANNLHSNDIAKNVHPRAKSTLSAFLLTVVSIILLVVASRILVHGAVSIATILNINELVIGLTIVAIGTSLPELAAAVAAARKGQHQMIIGNIIGSNVFNTLGVLGLTGVIRETQVNADAITRDFPMMFFFSILMLLFALTKGQLSRSEGSILLVGYVVYICYLAMTAIQ